MILSSANDAAEKSKGFSLMMEASQHDHTPSILAIGIYPSSFSEPFPFLSFSPAFPFAFLFAHLSSNVGQCYLTGNGVEKDPLKASANLERGVSLGHLGCIANFGNQREIS